MGNEIIRKTDGNNSKGKRRININNLLMKKVAFHTLGCKLNFAESSDLARTFTQNNYEQVSSKEFADVYVINTCTVTQVAEKKCRNAIRVANHINPTSLYNYPHYRHKEENLNQLYLLYY